MLFVRLSAIELRRFPLSFFDLMLTAADYGRSFFDILTGLDSDGFSAFVAKFDIFDDM